LDNPPPEATRGSPYFQDFVAACLLKDPSARPSAQALLHEHTDFFAGKDVNTLVEIIQSRPPLEERPNSSKRVSENISDLTKESDYNDLGLPEDEENGT